MPTYDYRCRSCDHQFEVYQAISAEPLEECPVCGGRVERMIGQGNGLIFKGSGFYATDYKKQQKGPESKSDKD
jgi:putative FmdB family regulatory protein